MALPISISPSGEEVNIICGYLQEDPRAIRGYLGFLQRHTNSENYNFASWVIRYVLVDPPASLKARVAQVVPPFIASQTKTPTEPKNFTLSLSEGARLKFVREMAPFAAERADLEALDYALAFPGVKKTNASAASIHTLASSSSCGSGRLSTLEYLYSKNKSAHCLGVILSSLEDEGFVKACFASPTLSNYYTERSFAIAISAACSGVSTLAIPPHTAAVNAVLRQQPNFSSKALGFFHAVRGFSHKDSRYHMTRTKIAALRNLFKGDLEHVLTFLAHGGATGAVEILLDLEDVRTVRVNIKALVMDGHVGVLRLILNHPKYLHRIDPKKRQNKTQQLPAGSEGASVAAKEASVAAEQASVAAKEASAAAEEVSVDAQDELVNLSPLIVLAAGLDNIEVLRLLLCKAKEYGLADNQSTAFSPLWSQGVRISDLVRALRSAVYALNVENVEELLKFEALKILTLGCYELQLLEGAIRYAIATNCVAIVFLFRHFYHSKYVPLEYLFYANMSFPMLNLLMESPRFAEISLKTLEGVLLENRPHTATILAAYCPFRTLSLEELNQFGLPSLEYLNALKALGRLEEILPQTVFKEMLRYMTKDGVEEGIPMVQALCATPQFGKLETGQLSELYKAATTIPGVISIENLNICIRSSRFQDIDLETLGEQLVHATNYVVATAPAWQVPEYIKYNKALSAEMVKAMIAAPRLRKISARHVQQLVDLEKNMEDGTLRPEVKNFLNSFPKDIFLEGVAIIRTALGPETPQT